MSVRQQLADAIADALATDPVWDGMQVYASPDDVTQVPAVVLMPADPWAVPATMGRGGGPGVWRWVYVVQLMVHRADPASALDQLEALTFDVTMGAAAIGAAVRGLSAPQTVKAAGVAVLISELDVELMTSRKG